MQVFCAFLQKILSLFFFWWYLLPPFQVFVLPLFNKTVRSHFSLQSHKFLINSHKSVTELSSSSRFSGTQRWYLLLVHLQSYRYTVLCSVEPINCLPVLMNILSNTFLRLFNSTTPIRVWSDPFYRVSVLLFLVKINGNSRAEVIGTGRVGDLVGWATSSGWGQCSSCWGIPLQSISGLFNGNFFCSVWDLCRVSVPYDI